ncbi:arsenate reductase (glutaredoxin) [Alphaproteobacteria bacterium]|nr:arsenate reductase (glutaredoxin) [Alphaproteobacteria bacterium]
MSVTIYHNPRCSKSRQTLSLIQEKGIDINIIEYLKTPPNISQLKQILKQLGYEPRQLMRKSEQIYKDLDLGNENKTAEDLVNAMAQNPILIERPIVLSGEKAAVGRPPESVLDIL